MRTIYPRSTRCSAPVSPQTPLCSPIPPPSLPTAPVPEAQHDPVWASKRAWGSGRLECFEAWDIPHCSFTQALCNTYWSRDIALQKPWEAKALSPPQWLPLCNLIMQAPCLHNNTQMDRQMERQRDRQTGQQTETWKWQAQRQLERERLVSSG